MAWQEERAGHVAKLQAKAVGVTEALDFLDRYTLQNMLVDPSTRFVAEQVAKRPELLTDQSYQAARYYGSKREQDWYWHQSQFINELAELVKADVGDGKNLDEET